MKHCISQSVDQSCMMIDVDGGQFYLVQTCTAWKLDNNAVSKDSLGEVCGSNTHLFHTGHSMKHSIKYHECLDRQVHSAPCSGMYY